MRTIAFLFLLSSTTFATDPVEDYIVTELATDLRLAYFLHDSTDIVDESANGDDGTATGTDDASTTYYQTDDASGAQDLQDEGDTIQGPTDALDEDADFTIVIVGTCDASLTSTSDPVAGLLRKGNGLGANIFYNGTTSDVDVEIVYGTQSHMAGSDLTGGDTFVLVFTWDASANESEIFIDGSSAGTQTITATGWDVSAVWEIGQVDNTATDEFPLQGVMDLFAVWDRLLTSTEIDQLFKHTTVGKQFIRGDTNSDGTVNITDLVFLSNYLNSSGSAPLCLASADVNDDNAVDVSDISYLSSFLNSSGPQPPAPYSGCGFETNKDSILCLDTSSTCD